MRWGQAVALVVGLAALAWMLAAVGFERIGHSVALGGRAVPVAVAIHAVQLFLAGLAWFEVVGRGVAEPLGLRGRDFARVRWIREGVNSLLPAAHIGGQVVGVGLLVGRGLAPVRAVVGTILDVVVEVTAQLAVIVIAVGLLFSLRGGQQDWGVWVGAGVAVVAVIVGGIVVALRVGALRWVEAALQRAAARWPAMEGQWSLTGLNSVLLERQADRRAMARAVLLDMVSWSMGALEVWAILWAMGVSPGLASCFVIESLAMVARSAGFAIPGAVGIQEGGFVLACGLFGINAEIALALSVLKRLRELVVASAAVVMWQLGRRAV